MKVKFQIICPYCGWKTKLHNLATDCVKEKEFEHKALYDDPWEAHDMAFSSTCPICDKDMGENFIRNIMEEENE